MDREPIKKFARRLLVSTCLTVGATAAAQAGTITEPPEFSHTQATPTNLLLGTTGVGGQASSVDADWVEFAGLLPGPLSWNLTDDVGTSLCFNFFSSTDVGLGGSCGTNPAVGITVPGNGVVKLNMGWEGSTGVIGNYTASFQAQGVPEPSTVAGVGMGLAAAALAALRRKKQ
jgi:hypothetical protein